jgi:alpha-N-arabinofuranosidase
VCFGLTVVLVPGVALSRAARSHLTMPDTDSDRSFHKDAQAPATASLFRYRRDDNAPDRLTRVHIDAAHTAAVPIDPLLFGNFVEHLGGVVYEGIWAQALLNPGLERIEARDQAPPPWELLGPAHWQAEGYLSPHCVRLSAGTAAQTGGVLRQRIHLPVHRIRRYTASLYLRAAESDGQMSLTLTEAERPERILAQARRRVKAGGWRRMKFPLVLPSDAPAKGAAVWFTIDHAGSGPVDVDLIEIFPDDNVQGIDPDVLKRSHEWHIPLLRYPGGNFASGYHWQDGIGRRASRPTRRNPAWGGIEPNHFGTDEFMTFCRLVGAQPQITVNAGDGTPEEAAAWVRYCNAPVSDIYGRRRAENGHPEPYGVKRWEVGNELYGSWQIGHTDAAGNAERFVRFRAAMLQADPILTVIATGKGDEYTAEGLKRNLAWNTALLSAATAKQGAAPDYLSLHPLVPLPGSLRRYAYDAQFESAMAQPAFLDRTLLPDLARLIAAIEGPQAKTRLAVTEWGIIVGGAGWQDSPNSDVLAGALFNALTLNAMLRHSDRVTLANMTALMHGGGIKKPAGVVIVDPQYWTQQLYAQARPHTPVATMVTGPGADVPERGALPAVADVPDVDIFAAVTADGKSLTVFAVNRHRTEPRPLQLEIDGFQVASISATILTAFDPQTRNTIEKPDAVAPQPFPTSPWPVKTGGAWRTTLPAHSLVLLTLKRR